MCPCANRASPSADMGSSQLRAVRWGHLVSDSLPSVVVQAGARNGSAGATVPFARISGAALLPRLLAIGGGGVGRFCNVGATTASAASNMLSRASVTSGCPQRSMAWRIEPSSGTSCCSGSSCSGRRVARRRASSSWGQQRSRLGGSCCAVVLGAAPLFEAGVAAGSARSWSHSARVAMRSCDAL